MILFVKNANTGGLGLQDLYISDEYLDDTGDFVPLLEENENINNPEGTANVTEIERELYMEEVSETEEEQSTRGSIENQPASEVRGNSSNRIGTRSNRSSLSTIDWDQLLNDEGNEDTRESEEEERSRDNESSENENDNSSSEETGDERPEEATADQNTADNFTRTRSGRVSRPPSRYQA